MTIEPMISGGFLARGHLFGRPILAEGADIAEAVHAWNTLAAERYAKIKQDLQRQRWPHV